MHVINIKIYLGGKCISVAGAPFSPCWCYQPGLKVLFFLFPVFLSIHFFLFNIFYSNLHVLL
jgi:hypothetical protein